MLKFKRKLLAAILAVSIVLSSGVVWSEGVDNDAAETTDAPSAEAPAEGEDGETGGGEEEAPPVTEEQALAEMREVAKNDDLTLYFNDTNCFFAVKNNKSGYIWWSTPYDYESDSVAGKPQKTTMASMLTFRPLDMETSSLPDTPAKSFDTAVQAQKFKVEDIENGVKITYEFTRYFFSIPVSIVLDSDKLKIRVHSDEINERTNDKSLKEYKLISLDLSQAFGAGRSNPDRNTEDGFIFVPDGSGAVINFNNGKTSTSVYKSKVYGKDVAISTSTAAAKTEQTYFPVLGIVKELEGHDEGMFAVVNKGDAYANVNAYVSGQNANQINSAWFSFDFRATDTFTMGAKTDLRVYQSGENRVDDVEVYYYFMTGDDVNVADLADTYRNYLINEKGLTKQSTDNANALTLTTMGGTITKKSVLGFPVDMQTVATSYSQAKEILEKLNGLGVDDIQLVYNEFTGSDMKGQVTTGADYSSKLGGKNDFKDLCSYTQDKGFAFYPGINFMEYTKSGNGYSFTLNSSKRVTKAYATQTDFNLAYGIPDTDVKPTWTILSPYYWSGVFDKVVKSFTNEGINNISLNQATSLLYSDFSRKTDEGKAQFVRQDSENILVEGYKKITDAGISIIAQECNAYALPYVSAITNVPLYSSNYDLFDYDVPFYQMVIHGYIPYSSKPVNASSNANELRLLSLMTGSAIHYELMYNSPNDFQDSLYDKYFYANYEGWLEIAADDYKMYNDISSSIKDETVVNYTRNGKHSFSMEYSDGTKIEVDTEALTVSVNGQAKNLADYGVKGVSD